MSIRINKFTQRGETIVEVLIALAVLSAALGGAFAISSRSQKAVQANHERYEAELIANEQADLLKVYLADTVNYDNVQTNLNDENKAFCVQAMTAQFDPSNPAAIDPACKRGVDGRYSVFVFPRSRTDISGANVVDTFIIRVEWDDFQDGNRAKVELVYGI